MSDSKDLVFLMYLRRSGSTYLSQLLDRLPDVGVSLEGSFLDGIVAPIFEPYSTEDLDRYLSLLYDDHASTPFLRELSKFRFWGIEREVLRTELRDANDLSFRRFLLTALKLHSRKPEASTWVYKNGNYIWHLPKIRHAFPEAKVVFVMRDPRGIYASQRRSLSSCTHEPMASNPFLVSRRFRKAAQIVSSCIDAPWFHCVQYEKLIEHPEREIETLCEFLGVSPQPVGSTAKNEQYSDRIPSSQRHLHENVSKDANTERIAAWQEDLSVSDRAAIELVSRRQMQRFEYPVSDSLPVSILNAMRHPKHWLECGQRALSRLWKQETTALPTALKALNH